jgi:hypothetical protein
LGLLGATNYEKCLGNMRGGGKLMEGRLVGFLPALPSRKFFLKGKFRCEQIRAGLGEMARACNRSSLVGYRFKVSPGKKLARLHVKK